MELRPAHLRSRARRIVFVGALAAASSGVACGGCRSATSPGTASAPATPTIRLYLLSDLGGALEPCGCTKDQLGGIDHAAAWMASERVKAPAFVVATAGPLFFMDPALKPDNAAQDTAKAETLATVLRKVDIAAFAPAKNDWAGGEAALSKLREASGAAMLFANAARPVAGAVPFVVREVNGVKVGFVGVSLPDVPGVATTVPIEGVRSAIAGARGEGAKVLVALASVGRGEAKRIADLAPELTAILVGSAAGGGEANTEGPPPERVGNVIIVETANHLQTVGVLDLFVRDGDATFADATGLALGQKRAELTRRTDELHVKIAGWERDIEKGLPISRPDLDARRADLAKLEAERASLDAARPPATGSFFRYTVKEVRVSLGQDPRIFGDLSAYYEKVNDANKVAFADRRPRPAGPDEARYLGTDACSTCHDAAKAVWDKTRHARAYETLTKAHKEFNLDCVSCHVTGYDRPGGSTVTHVAKLTNVQCEACHGPGSLHAASPKVPVPMPAPKPDMCLECHHPPHVEGFEPAKKMAEILGPGHGK
jgi:hypothetical protein